MFCVRRILKIPWALRRIKGTIPNELNIWEICLVTVTEKRTENTIKVQQKNQEAIETMYRDHIVEETGSSILNWMAILVIIKCTSDEREEVKSVATTKLLNQKRDDSDFMQC